MVGAKRDLVAILRLDIGIAELPDIRGCLRGSIGQHVDILSCRIVTGLERKVFGQYKPRRDRVSRPAVVTDDGAAPVWSSTGLGLDSNWHSRRIIVHDARAEV